MGFSTHVLDTMNGCPAAGMQVALYQLNGSPQDASAQLLKKFQLNADGRNPDGLLIDLQSKKIYYHPEPDCVVNYELSEPDIVKVDNFIRNNII